MSTIAQCPNGHLVGITTAMEGNTVQCPLCQGTFVAPRAAVPSVVEEYVAVESIPEVPTGSRPVVEEYVAVESIPELPIAPLSLGAEEAGYRLTAPERTGADINIALRRKKPHRRATQAQLRSLDRGLACYYFKHIISVCMVLLSFTVWVLIVAAQAAADLARPGGQVQPMWQLPNPPQPDVRPRVPGGQGQGDLRARTTPNAGMIAAAVLFLLVLLAQAAALILGIAGAIFFLRVPPASGARGLARANLLLEALPPLVFGFGLYTLIAGMIHQDAAALLLGVVMFLIAGVMLVGGFIIFMIFLAALANFQKDDATSAEAIKVMLLTLAVLIGTPILLFLAILTFVKTPWLLNVVPFAIILFSAIAHIKLLFGILSIISTLRGRL